MRKHKSVVAVLLAVMMIFTFMPVMSFAEDSTEGPKNVSGSAKWDSTFSKMTYDKVSYDTYSRVYGSDGTITVKAGNDNIAGIKNPLYAVTTYYDVSKATITGASKWTYDLFTSRFTEDTGVVSDGLVLTMHKPDNAKYASDYDATKDAASEAAWSNNDYETVFYATGFDKTKVYEDQDVTITALVRTTKTGSEATTANAKLLGSVADTKTITVKAREGEASQVKLYVDSVSDKKEIGASGNTFTYDGKAHKVVAKEVPGFTTKLALFNNDTKKYEDKEEIEVKDAKTYSIKYIVTKTSDGSEVVGYQTLTINPAAVFGWDFESTVLYRANNSNYPKVPANAKPEDYIVVKNIADSDKEEAMKMFAEVYDVKSAPFQGNEKLAKWEVTAKDLDVDAYKALYKKYKTLADNYGIDGTSGHIPYFGQKIDTEWINSTVVEFTADSAVNSKDDDITFTGLTKQTFKAKKKTKKLAKAKTLAVNVANESGNEMTFSYKTTNKKVTFDAASMKIKVKKGTKKGTYKVTVKAKTAAGNGYKAAKESQTYTIVVK